MTQAERWRLNLISEFHVKVTKSIITYPKKNLSAYFLYGQRTHYNNSNTAGFAKCNFSCLIDCKYMYTCIDLHPAWKYFIQSTLSAESCKNLAFAPTLMASEQKGRPEGRNFQRGVRLIRQGVLGPLKAPRSPWVFGAKSCNLTICRHFIQTFGKTCFPLLIFKDFHQILHQ